MYRIFSSVPARHLHKQFGPLRPRQVGYATDKPFAETMAKEKQGYVEYQA